MTLNSSCPTMEGLNTHVALNYCEGPARQWYGALVRQVLANHEEVPCRQGIALESPHALASIVPGAENLIEALAMVDLPRRGDSTSRTTFSILHAMRRLLGYPECVLFDRYPVLAQYSAREQAPYYARATFYATDHVPQETADEPWVSRVETRNGPRFVVDQFLRAATLIASAPTTRRALVDFGDAYKSRCMLNWVFLARNGAIRLHQHMRSNDLVVGMPNDLIDGRLAQSVMAAITGNRVGPMSHNADVIQIYRRDVAGVDCVTELEKMDFSYNGIGEACTHIAKSPVTLDAVDVLAPWIGRPLAHPSEALHRWQRIMTEIETVFWKHNSACSPENRHCVQHLVGRYRGTHGASTRRAS